MIFGMKFLHLVERLFLHFLSGQSGAAPEKQGDVTTFQSGNEDMNINLF